MKQGSSGRRADTVIRLPDDNLSIILAYYHRVHRAVHEPGRSAQLASISGSGAPCLPCPPYPPCPSSSPNVRRMCPPCPLCPLSVFVE